MSAISACNALATPSNSWSRCFAITPTTTVEEFAEGLREHPCDLAQGGMMGITVLHQAASVGNIPLIQEIVRRCPTILQMMQAPGATVLGCTARRPQSYSQTLQHLEGVNITLGRH